MDDTPQPTDSSRAPAPVSAADSPTAPGPGPAAGSAGPCPDPASAPAPWSRALGLGLLVLAAVALVAPSLIAHRFGPQPTRELDAFWAKCNPVARSLAAPFAAIGLTLLGAGRRARGAALPILATVICYVALCVPFFDWIIDDAGISFAYAENLALGHGLVLHPSHRPEEGYSNLLWVLVLAGVRVLGMDIALAAKALGIALGALTIALALHLALRLVRELSGPSSGAASGAPSEEPSLAPPGEPSRHAFVAAELLMPAAAVMVSAPYVIWTSSGLENAIAGLLMMLVVAAPGWRHGGAVTAAALATLILVRPEAPLFVAAVIAADLLAGGATDRAGWVRGVKRHVPLAMPALAAMAGQYVLRLAYFHDPMPNPYYAKVTGLNPLRLINVFGGGWIYTLGWLRATHLLVIVPIAMLGLRWPSGPAGRVRAVHARIAAVLGAQLAFILMVNGDWMKAWRFFSVLHAPLAVWLTVAFAELARSVGLPRARAVALVVCAAVGLATVSALVDFRWSPVTPMDRIAQLGETFNELARRLGIDHPRIAWHDSGGSSYRARIDVVDLGGLGNRDIARHKTDREYMRRYLFEQTRPAFFLSDDKAFAALWCGFHTMPEFTRDYAPLELPAALGTPAPICAIRRDLVRDVPGIRVVRENGRITRVIAEP